MKKYCYRTPKFPPHAFVATLTVEREDELSGMFTLSTIYTSTAEFCFDVFALKDQLEPDIYDALGSEALIAPLVFDRSWPLKREYWEHPTVPLPAEERQKQFLNVLKSYTLYTLLATPFQFTKSYTILSAALPLPVKTSDQVIEEFMKSSTYPVIESANAAAIYRFEQPYGIEWKTGKILKRPQPPEIQ